MLVDPAFKRHGKDYVRVSLWRVPKVDYNLFREHLNDFFQTTLKCDEERYENVMILEGRANEIRKKLLLLLAIRTKNYEDTFTVVEKCEQPSMSSASDRASDHASDNSISLSEMLLSEDSSSSSN
jgi:hypothetical protein